MKSKTAIILLLLIAAFMRFYGLNWSGQVVWHPDERNMSIAITQFRLPEKLTDLPTCFNSAPNVNCQISNVKCACNLNPHFFAYGGFPLYLGFSTAALYQSAAQLKVVRQVDFQEATMALRVISANASILSVYLVFLISKLLVKPHLAYTAALLTAFIPALIQSAHFGTTESLLSFLLLQVSYLSVRFYQTRNSKYLFYLSLTLGLALSTKVSVLAFFAGPLISILVTSAEETRPRVITGLLNLVRRLITLLTLTAAVTALTAPFNLLAFNEFRAIFNYDIPVALGKLQVFYTSQFINTWPFFFQLEKIFPFALGLSLTLFGLPAIVLSLTYSLTKRNPVVFLVIASFLPFFIINLFYFTKWTRYISPTFPFLAILAVFCASLIGNRIARAILLLTLTTFTILQGLAFFTIYAKEDVRFTASKWIFSHIPSQSIVLSETANVSDIPIFANNSQPSSYSIQNILFNFYDLESSQPLQEELVRNLQKSDYIFIPSRRIFKNFLRLKDSYPIVNRYYERLFDGSLGFTKIAEFESFPFSINDEDAEETFTVFDHPVIRIYKKTVSLNQDDYRQILNISP